MADEPKTTKPGTDYSDQYGAFLARQAYGPAYATDPRLSYQHYMRTKAPMRGKAAGTVAGISIAGALAERAVQASAMFDPALDYAREELAEAAQIEASAPPKVSEEEKYAIRTGALAPARVEAQEIKSDVGALLASRGDATVKDLLATREVGVGKIATAGLHAEAAIGKRNWENVQKHHEMVKDAQKRQDDMQQTLFDARAEQRGHTAGLIRDAAHIAATWAGHNAAGEEQPMIDKMVDEGVPWPEIEKMHAAARKAGFWPGTRGYEQYLMAHYEGMPTEVGTGKTTTTPKVGGEPVKVSTPRAGTPEYYRQLQEKQAAVSAQERPAEPVTGTPDVETPGAEAARRLKAAAPGGPTAEMVDPDDPSYKYKAQADGTYAVYRQRDGKWEQTGTARPGTKAFQSIRKRYEGSEAAAKEQTQLSEEQINTYGQQLANILGTGEYVQKPPERWRKWAETTSTASTTPPQAGLSQEQIAELRARGLLPTNRDPTPEEISRAWLTYQGLLNENQ